MSRHARISLLSLLAVMFVYSICTAQVAWVERYDDALKQAAAQKKFVVVDLSASWCGFCRKMASEVYPDNEFVEFSRGQVFVRLFTDTNPEGDRLARKFGIRGFPTIIVLNPKGEEAGRLEGFRPAPALIRGLKAIIENPAPPPARGDGSF